MPWKTAAKPQAKAAGPTKPRPSAKPETVDDLKAISGVGPKLEQVLNKLGIWTYAQIAELARARLPGSTEELGFSGRIGRDDWTGQARKLAGGK
jgi:NADH-quinone oxidoreductase subunit E